MEGVPCVRVKPFFLGVCVCVCRVGGEGRKGGASARVGGRHH